MNTERYNKQRKEILEKLDQGNDISIIELGMYDLTPYFNMDEFDINLTETIMLNQNAERKVYHTDKDLYFSPPQYEALKCLQKNNRVILSAPTSFGKTLLVKEYIYLEQPKHIVYIVPTNALAYELEKSFKENEKFSNYTIFDKCSTIENLEENSFDDNLLFIGTQEKYLEIDKEMIGNIDLFVIDEAYKLQESVTNQRAYKLSEAFLNSVTGSSDKVFLLTPKACFYGFDKYEFYLYESDFNVVEKNYIVIEKDNFFNVLLEKGHTNKTILFCGSPRQINDTCHVIINGIENTRSNDFIKQLETEIHPDWSVVKLLKVGVLTHHGQMPKYVQNKMINLFNNSSEYNILVGTNSISEGINTVTKNLFIHPDYRELSNILLLKNTVGRAGRLGEYPIGYIYSTVDIEEAVESEIEISLAISDEEELAEIEDSNNDEMILLFCEEYKITYEFCKYLLATYKLSLTKIRKIFEALKENCRFPGMDNLPFIANRAFSNEYTGIPNIDAIVIKGYLQNYYLAKTQRVYLNNFNDWIDFFNLKSKQKLENTDIINCYMQFIYSTLEYYIMPIVNIGLDLYEHNNEFPFGENVIGTLEKCKQQYYRKTYGNVNFDELSETHKKIIGTLKDYGMTHIVKLLNEGILNEIESQLNIRYSTIDVLRAIEKLSISTSSNRAFYEDLRRKYMG